MGGVGAELQPRPRLFQHLGAFKHLHVDAVAGQGQGGGETRDPSPDNGCAHSKFLRSSIDARWLTLVGVSASKVKSHRTSDTR